MRKNSKANSQTRLSVKENVSTRRFAVAPDARAPDFLAVDESGELYLKLGMTIRDRTSIKILKIFGNKADQITLSPPFKNIDQLTK